MTLRSRLAARLGVASTLGWITLAWGCATLTIASRPRLAARLGVVSTLGWITLAWGCATLTIASQPPGAQVYLIHRSDGATPKSQRLGATPLRVPEELLSAVVSDATTLRLEREGFASAEIAPEGLTNGDHRLFVVLPTLAATGTPDAANRIARLTLAAQRQLWQGQYDQALATTRELQKASGKIIPAMEIAASAHFLKGDYDASHAAWLSVLELQPTHAGARKMMREASRRREAAPSP